jgi:hypothetical protein
MLSRQGFRLAPALLRQARAMMRTRTPFAAYVLLLSQALLPACQHDTTFHGPASSQGGGVVGGFLAAYDIGEKVFVIVRSRLAASPDHGAEKAAALDARRGEFIAAVDAVITPNALQSIGPSIKALFGLIDDGTLPRMAENVAQVLEILKNETDQRTLKALVALASTRAVIQTGDLLAYAARVANYGEIEKTFEAIAQLIQANDGVDDQGRKNGEPDLVHDVLAFASRLLREAGRAPAPAAGPGLFDGIAADLLEDAPPRGTAAFGAPSYAVRVDLHGNPAVLRDPATGRLYPPFVDADGDGAADVNGQGDPVDAAGRAISIPPFGPPGAAGRDAEGRALAASGAPIYDYFDTKRTLLSHFLQLGGEALRRGIHDLAAEVAEIALGVRVWSDAGTPADPSDDFLGFAADEPVADLAFGVLEICKYEGAPKLFRAIAEVERTDPALAERVLVAVGKVVEKLRPIALAPGAPPSGQQRALVDQAILLADQVFATGGASGPSTGRELFDVVHQLGRSARSLPGQLALMIDYKTLVLDASGNVDPARSVRVDRSLPATRAGSPQGENRSVLQQVLDLLADADGCKTFFNLFGASLSETLIELMAGRSPQFVGTLIDFVDSSIVQLYLSIACPAIKDEVLGLKGLSASGALEGFLPIAKVFVDRGETRLLIDILKTLDQSYPATIRPYEAEVSDILRSGAIEQAFDLDDLLVAGGPNGGPIVDPASGERAIDVIADSIANLVSHPAAGVPDRWGRAQPTLVHLVLEPLRRIDDRIYAASGGQALANALGYAVTDLLVERRTNDNGTPADPSDDFEELVNPSVGPFLAKVLEHLARNLPASAAARAAMLSEAQQSIGNFLASRDFAAAVDLARTLRRATGAAAIRDAVVHLLTPDPVAANDVFASVLKLTVEVLQTHLDAAPLRDLASFAGELFDPEARHIVALVEGAARILEADRGHVVLAVARNLLNEPAAAAGLAPGESPAEVLLSIFEDVRRAGGAGPASPADRLAELVSFVDAAIAFIRDRSSGLERIFDVIKNRPHS